MILLSGGHCIIKILSQFVKFFVQNKRYDFIQQFEYSSFQVVFVVIIVAH